MLLITLMIKLLLGYWKTVDSKEQADFILNLDVNFSIFYTINAQAITKNNKIIKRFKSKNTFKSLDANPKNPQNNLLCTS